MSYREEASVQVTIQMSNNERPHVSLLLSTSIAPPMPQIIEVLYILAQFNLHRTLHITRTLT